MNSLIKNSPGNRSPKINSSLKKSKYEFEKPSLRCSGPYFSEYEQSTMQISSNKNKNLGRSRFIFKSELEKSEIKNYVQRTPSRPPSAHNFR